MEVILLEKVRNLGDIGDQVKIRPGFGRNFLIPQGKAVSATKTNVEKFAKMRAELLAKAEAVLKSAKERAEKLANLEVTIPAKVSDEGKLFGSIGVGTIAHAFNEKNADVKKSEINLPQGPIRQIGEHDITLSLHTDVIVTVKVKVVPEE